MIAIVVTMILHINHWSFAKDLRIHSAITLTKKICSNRADLLKSACRKSPPPSLQIHVLKSATGQLLTCACRNSPPVCRFSKICHWTVTCACRIPPPVCRCSQICHWIVTYMCLQNSPSPHSLQIFSNLPLDSYLHVLVEIPPRFADFLKSAIHCRFTEICMAEIPPSF